MPVSIPCVFLLFPLLFGRRTASGSLCLQACNVTTLVYSFLEKEKKQPRAAKKARCRKDTGGTCNWFDCYSFRNADCVNGKCVCGPRQCVEASSQGNRCVNAPPPTPAPTPPPPPAQPTKGTKLVFQAGCTEKQSAIKFVKVSAGYLACQ